MSISLHLSVTKDKRKDMAKAMFKKMRTIKKQAE